MGLFGRKEKASTASTRREPSASVSPEYREKAENKSCQGHMDAQLLLKTRGVVLKLYLENFKRMNDLFGFEYCDELLGQIKEYLEQKTGCRVFRYVGVEFILILKNCSVREASQVAENIIERFNENWVVGNTDCLCSVQIALCAYPGYAPNATEMLKCLDMAASQAAEMGSNQYAVYDKALHGQFLRKQAIARYLSTAIANEEVEICYRPTYNRELKKFTRAEFLMRVFIKDVGMVSSAEFLPVAEDTGQVRLVEYYALDKAAAFVEKLVKKQVEFESVIIPISSVLFLQGDFLQEVSRVMEKYKIPPKKLAIQVDEFVTDASHTNITVLLQNLSWMGIELILDNFGSGSTGLGQVFELPVDTLKFGRMFIWQLENNPKTAPVNAGLVQIAKMMKKNVMADGVETKKQKDFLDKFGCYLQQGPYYTPVMAEEEAAALLAKSREDLRRESQERKAAYKR